MKILLSLSLIYSVGIIASDKLIEKDFKKKIYKTPLREFSVILTDDGFYPHKLMAFTGERVKFFITSTSKKSQCLILQKHEIFISAEKGQLNEGDTELHHPGRYKFYCPSSEHSGFLTVMDKDKEVKRAVASEKEADKPNYWTPRNYDE